MYYQAEQAGVVVSDGYVDEVIRNNIQIFSQASSDDYIEFLEGIGMTNEEYWYSRADELKITESIAAWKELKYKEYMEQVDTSAEDIEKQWETYYNQLEADLIAEEHVQFIDSSIQ